MCMMNRIAPLIAFFIMLAVTDGYAQVCDIIKPICSSQTLQNNNAVDPSPTEINGVCANLNGARVLWYLIQIDTPGEFTFQIKTNSSLLDYDFAVYLNRDCNDLGTAIRSSFALPQTSNNDTGLSLTATDECESETGDGQVRFLDVAAGDEIIIAIDRYSDDSDNFEIEFRTSGGGSPGSPPPPEFSCIFDRDFFGPDNILVCSNETVTLEATIDNAVSYVWSLDDGSGVQVLAGETGPTLDINNQGGTYSVEATNNEAVVFIDEVVVGFANTPVANPLPDLQACPALVPGFSDAFDTSMIAATLLGAQSPADVEITLYDSAGAALPTPMPAFISNTIVGRETITARAANALNPNCFTETTFDLIVYQPPIVPQFSISDSSFICADVGSVAIGMDLGNANYTYSWSNGSTSAVTIVTTPGDYTLTVTNNENGVGCTYEQTVTVGTSDIATITSIDATYFAGNTVTVNAEGVGNYEYQLGSRPFQDSNVFQNVRGGEYIVTVNDKNGCGAVQGAVLVVDYPRFFTPNGDGFHDTWNIVVYPQVPINEIFIFDRYGKLVKQLAPGGPGWNGTFNGKQLPSSDYWFTVAYVRDGQALEFRGHFSLKR